MASPPGVPTRGLGAPGGLGNGSDGRSHTGGSDGRLGPPSPPPTAGGAAEAEDAESGTSLLSACSERRRLSSVPAALGAAPRAGTPPPAAAAHSAPATAAPPAPTMPSRTPSLVISPSWSSRSLSSALRIRESRPGVDGCGDSPPPSTRVLFGAQLPPPPLEGDENALHWLMEADLPDNTDWVEERHCDLAPGYDFEMDAEAARLFLISVSRKQRVKRLRKVASTCPAARTLDTRLIYNRAEAMDVDDVCHRCWARGTSVDQVLDESRRLTLAEGGVSQELAPLDDAVAGRASSASGSDASSSTDFRRFLLSS